MSSLHLDILTREFTRRVGKNGRYSMRAYANFLGLHPSALSRVLTGKWDLTTSSGIRIAKKLLLPIEERRRFMRSVLEARTKKELKRIGQLIEAPDLRPTPKKISEELYAKVARLESLALLQLTFAKDFRPDIDWIAEALDMNPSDVKELVATLLKSGLLKKVGDTFVNAEAHMTAVESVSTNESRKKLQIEILTAAVKAIEDVPFDERLNYGMTMTIDPSKLPLVREKVMAFIETLSDDLECDDRCRVYQLGVSLFPLSRSLGDQ